MKTRKNIEHSFTSGLSSVRVKFRPVIEHEWNFAQFLVQVTVFDSNEASTSQRIWVEFQPTKCDKIIHLEFLQFIENEWNFDLQVKFWQIINYDWCSINHRFESNFNDLTKMSEILISYQFELNFYKSLDMSEV